MDKTENSRTEHSFLLNPCVLNDFTCGSALDFRISFEVYAAHKDMVSRLFMSEKGVESETGGVFLTWKIFIIFQVVVVGGRLKSPHGPDED